MKGIFIVIVLLCTSCISFRISEEEFRKAFAGESAPLVSDTLDINGETIHFVYTDQCRDGLVIFVHGSPGSWSAFIDYFKIDSLLQQYDLLSIDRPGFGASDYGRPEPSIEHQAYLLTEVIKGFPHQKKILVGHSLGGPVVARIAMDYPDLADGMLLLAPSVDPALEKDEWFRDWIDTRVGGWFTPTDFWVSNKEILPLKGELEKMVPLWDKVKIPTLVLHGKRDDFVPWQNAEFVRAHMPDSLVEVVYFKELNHFLVWTIPEEVVAGIRLVGELAEQTTHQ